jgi:DNA-damage-inducible protein J
MKAAFVRARIEPVLKRDAEEVLSKLGISSSEAVNLFYSQIVLKRGLPFPVELPNDDTINTFVKTDKGEELVTCKDANDLFQRLGI